MEKKRRKKERCKKKEKNFTTIICNYNTDEKRLAFKG